MVDYVPYLDLEYKFHTEYPPPILYPSAKVHTLFLQVLKELDLYDSKEVGMVRNGGLSSTSLLERKRGRCVGDSFHG